jgi:hypothetical protein
MARDQPAARTDEVLIEVPESDRGLEVLRAEPAPGGGYRIRSVPVFLYGLSRGAVVDAAPGPRAGRLRFRALRAPSPGATVRCYVAPAATARRAYEDHLRGGAAARLGLGPVSLFAPDVVAVHVADRRLLARVGAYLDRLVLEGVLRFWEPGDPGAPTAEGAEDPDTPPWELVHPPTGDENE